MVAALFLVLAAAPSPAALPEIPAPLGHLGSVVEEVPKGGVSGADRPLLVTFDSTRPAQAIYLMRFLGGTARAVEQLQQWLDRVPGFEKKLFGRKDVLGEVVKLLTDSKLEPQRSCTAPPLVDGYRLALTAPPKKWCPSDPAMTTGDFWWFNKDRPAAVVNVLAGSPDVARPRLSAVLFDAKGQARVRFHADWGSAPSATLLGEKCQLVDFTFDSAREAFTATVRSCKR